MARHLQLMLRYRGTLGFLLFWLLDRSDGQRATDRFVAVIRRVLPPFSLALRLRVLRDLVRDLDELARQALYGEPARPAKE